MRASPRWLAALAAASLAAGLAAGSGAHGEPRDDPELKRQLDLPVDAAGEAREEAEAPEVISYFGGLYEGDVFLFVLDTSESMEGSPLAALQRETRRAISTMCSAARFNIIAFNTKNFVFRADRPVAATEANKAAASGFVDAFEARGSTHVRDAVLEALRQAERVEEGKRATIILFCDGYPAPESPEETLEVVTARNVRRVPIHTILLGKPSQNETVNRLRLEFLRELAARNGGQLKVLGQI